MKNKLLLVTLLLFSYATHAAEGMWIPLLVEQQILPEMQAEGCKLTAEQIYSAEKACLKDAVVRVGGCTGSYISNQGLVLTNFHCAQSFVAKASEGLINYIREGFFASSQAEEIPTSKLTVENLIAMYDVTDRCSQGLSPIEVTAQIVKDSSQEFQYSIEEFYGNSQFLLFKSKKYTDVRLVAFMPADIASYGGDVANWSWPRSCADFALLRVYENGKPIVPKKYLEINAKGVSNGDFTMVMGYPGETKMYGTEQELKDIYSILNPAQIAMREATLQPMAIYMSKGQKEHDAYLARYSSLSNYYEKWKGEQYGIETSDALKKRHTRDSLLQTWISSNDSLQSQYGTLFSDYNKLCRDYYVAYTHLVVGLEGLWRMRILQAPSSIVVGNNPSFMYEDQFVTSVAKCNMELEGSVFENMLFFAYASGLTKTPTLERIYSGNKQVYTQFLDSVLNKSVFTDSARAAQFSSLLQSKHKFKKQKNSIAYLLKNDALYRITDEIYNEIVNKTFPEYANAKLLFDSVANRMIKVVYAYTKGAMSPDANSTMRIGYGKVTPYGNMSATTSEYFIAMLSDSSNAYKSNEIFNTLLRNKDFGTYSKDTLFMNFVATNQTSGGNSGSPVLDGEGSLVGVNFDRNWQGVMSDFNYDETYCRNISVDIRYILFCLEKYGHANNIIAELTFKKNLK